MKQLRAAGALALAVLAGTDQSASAWCSYRFSINLNCDFSCGCNHCCGWGGLCYCGPPPGYNSPMYGLYAPPGSPMANPYHAAAPINYPVNYAATGAAPAPPSAAQAPGYYQAANYPQGYPTNYYLMNYAGAAHPYGGGAINFYGN